MSISPFKTGLFIFFFAASAVASDALITSLPAEPSNLIPCFAADTASAEISRLIFNGLVKYDKNLKLTGDLAQNWEILDEGKRIVFHLRKNVRWQDGAPLTAEDVRFTFEKIKDPNTPTPYGGDFEKVEAVRVIDEHTLEVIYREPFAPGLASWGMGILPKHLLEKENLMSTAFSRKPVGTGPFILKKWSSEKIELWRNPDYFEGAPGLERMVYRILPDTSTAFLELQTENLDSMGLAPIQFKRQSDTPFFQKHFRKFRYPSFSYTYIGYNLTNPLFRDVKVRKAMGLAISKQEIIDVTLMGYGRIATGPFLPGGWAYNPSVETPSFDPERAKLLLKDAGWRDSDGDGILDKDGKKFSFTLLTNFGNDQRKQACEMIQKYLSQVGIEVKIQVLEWGIFLREHIDKKNFEAVLLAWQLPPDPDIFDIFHSSRQAPGQFNFVGYENKDVDRHLEEGRRSFEEAARSRAYHEIHRILAEEEPYTFLYVPEALPILHKRFEGVELAPAGLSHNLIHWQVAESERRYRFKKDGVA